MADLPGPRHLLEFDADPNLQFCYRALVPNTNEHSAKTGFGNCEACRSPLSKDDRPRLQPLPRMTKKIEKLINKRNKKLPLNRFESFKLKRFIDSSQLKMVKCSECEYVNKTPIIKREDLVKLKDKLILKVTEPQQALVEEPVEAANTKRKRKKKKKKKHSNPNSLLTDDEEEKDDPSSNSHTPMTLLTPLPSQKKTAGRVSLSQFLKSQTKDTSSSTIFRQALMSSTTPQIPTQTQTPVVARSAVLHQVKTSAKSATPSTSSTRKKSVKMHKQLKQFLSAKPAESDVAASGLKNFLALLG